MRISMIGAAGALACALAMSSPTASSAHVPDECEGHALHAQKQVERYGVGLGLIQGLSAADVSNHLPRIQQVFQQSLDTIEAATAVVACAAGIQPEEAAPEAAPVPPEVPITVPAPAPAPAPAEHGDWRTLLDEALVFAGEYEVALSIQGRCTDAYFEAYYGRPSGGESFLDVVTKWARAKQQGQYADTLEAMMLSDMSQAQSLANHMQRQQIADRDRYAFSREHVEGCRAAGIRALASQ